MPARHRRRDSAPRQSQRFALSVGVLAAGLLVWQTTNAAFTATTSNAGNSFSTGTVVLVDNDGGSVLFTATNLKPGDTGSKCITVTYQGSLAADIRLYGTASGTAGTGPGATSLDKHLTITIDQGTSTYPLDCTGFATAQTLVSNVTLETFATARTNFSNGVGTWNGATNAQARTYRIRWDLPTNVANAAQGGTASATFTWEAQNT